MQKKIDPGHASLCNSMPILLGGGGGWCQWWRRFLPELKNKINFKLLVELDVNDGGDFYQN
jgi:hypothetical protein